MVSRNDIFLGTTYAETLREIGVLKTSKKSKILVLNNEKNMYMRMCIHSNTCSYIPEGGSTGWGLACPFWKLKKCPDFRKKYPEQTWIFAPDFRQCTTKYRVMSDEDFFKTDVVVWCKVKSNFYMFPTCENSEAFGKRRPLLLSFFYEHFNR